VTGRPARTRPLLLQRDFGVYWAASLLATSGMWLWRITGPILLFELTSSAFMLGVLSVASYGPILLLSFAGGVLADRFPRRALIAMSHGLTGTLFAVLAAVHATSGLSPALLCCAAVVEGVAVSLAKPALNSFVAELVPTDRLAEAIAVNTAQFTLAQLVGPAVATGLLVVGGPALPLAVAAALYLPLVVAMRLVHSHHAPHRGMASARLRDLVGTGLTAVRQRPVAQLLLVIAVGSIALEGGVRVLAPQFVRDALGRAESSAGMVLTGQALGSVVAVLVIGRVQRRWPPLRVARQAFVVIAFALAGYALAPNVGVALALAAVIGAAQTTSFSVATSALHQVTADHLRGRIMAVHAMALLGMRPVAGLAAGSLASVAGPRLASGAFVLLGAAGVLAVRRVATVLHEAPSTPELMASRPTLATSPGAPR